MNSYTAEEIEALRPYYRKIRVPFPKPPIPFRLSSEELLKRIDTVLKTIGYEDSGYYTCVMFREIIFETPYEDLPLHLNGEFKEIVAWRLEIGK